MRRDLAITLAITLLAATPAMLPAQTDRLRLEPITFVQREFEVRPDTTEAEEGWLRVPLRHHATVTDSATIHFIRFRSTAADPGPPIVYLAGGPGGAGSYSAAGDRWNLFQSFRAFGDVIALDQRGVRGTDPYMVCPGSWDYPLDAPADPNVLRDALRPFLEQCYEHWADSVDVQAFNTMESAEDMDDLREALGEEQLIIWGISYGTHLGLAYIRQYPDRVARAILAGVEGPDHTYKLPANLDKVLIRVDSAMKRDPALSTVVPDFLGELRRVLERLRHEPVRVTVRLADTSDPVTIVIGPNDVRRAVYGELGEREDIVELPARAATILQDDWEPLARVLARGRLGNRELVMSLAMDCASGLTPARQALIGEQARTAIMGDVGNLTLAAKCEIWPHADLGDQFRNLVYSEVPLLFISGTLDARTPPSNAEEVRAGFPNGHHLIIEGGSHDDDLFLVSPVILETMLAFVAGKRDLPSRVTLPPLRFAIPRTP